MSPLAALALALPLLREQRELLVFSTNGNAPLQDDAREELARIETAIAAAELALAAPAEAPAYV